MKYVGVDLHKQVISVCVVIQEDNKRLTSKNKEKEVVEKTMS